jgi:hypothetical protein
MPLILEGIVTTTNSDGSINVAPMGPIVDREITRLTLRPFRSSRTYANLKQFAGGVFHVTDDVELLARAAIDQFSTMPELITSAGVPGGILADACQWFAFQVLQLDDRNERTNIECAIVDRGRLREFFGFNRAKHAVLEGAILATRIGIQPAQQIRDEYERLAIVVQKTAGDQETRAWRILESYVEQRLGQKSV